MIVMLLINVFILWMPCKRDFLLWNIRREATNEQPVLTATLEHVLLLESRNWQNTFPPHVQNVRACSTHV
jgi:hypothetical protein